MNLLLHWNKIPVCGLIAEKAVKETNLRIITNEIVFPSLIKSYIKSGLNVISNHDLEFLKIEGIDIYFASGWDNKHQNKLVKSLFLNGKTIVLTLDNSFKGSFRQLIGSIYFRLFLKRYYTLAFVPGISSRRLMRFFGFSSYEIFTGFYGAHSSIYYIKTPIILREDEFLFVGQIIDRKGILELISAFKSYRLMGGSWVLRIVGSGNLESNLPTFPGLIYEGKKTPTEISDLMNRSKCLVLPSKEDHWGTVVCEAAACGMIIMISRFVGSHYDLLDGNGFLIKSIKKHEIIKYLFRVSQLSEVEQLRMSQKSSLIASGYNEYSFNSSIKEIRNKLWKR